MNILNLDFLTIGFIICIIAELVKPWGRKQARNYFKVMDKDYIKKSKNTPSDINGGSCLLALFYLFFVIWLLWTDLWIIALLLLVFSVVTAAIMKPIQSKYRDLLDLGVKPQMKTAKELETQGMLFLMADRFLSIGLLVYGMLLHLSSLGIIAL